MRIVLAGLFMFLTGCAGITTSQYRSWSAGATGCLPDDITISHAKSVVWAGQGIDWLAHCRGQTYVCSHSGSATCTKAASTASGSQSPTPST